MDQRGRRNVPFGNRGRTSGRYVDRGIAGEGTADRLARAVVPPGGAGTATRAGHPFVEDLPACWRRLQSLLARNTELAPGARLELERKGPGGGCWQAVWDGNWDMDVAPAMLDHAAEALVAVARWLPLSRSEVPVASIGTRWYLQMDIVDTDDGATSFRIVSAADIRRFIESRNHVAGTTDWDASRARRVVRRAPTGTLHVLEPGTVWFVECLEAAGAETFYSSEGHPEGFYLLFAGTRPVAEAAATSELVSVEISSPPSVTPGMVRRSGLDATLWCVRMREEPLDFGGRDHMLREIAARWASAALKGGLEPRQGGLDFGVPPSDRTGFAAAA